MVLRLACLLLLAASCALPSSLDPACAGARERLDQATADFDAASDPNWVPPAPPIYQWFCAGEPEYAERDAMQQAASAAFESEFLQEEKTAGYDLVTVLEQDQNCHLLTPAESTALSTRAKKLIADRTTASLWLVRNLPQPERYDYYSPSIRAAIKVAREQNLLGADYDVFPTLQAMVAEQLTYYLDHEFRTAHDMRYSTQTFFELLREMHVLGSDVADPNQWGPRIARALTFDYLWSQESRLEPAPDTRTVCFSEILNTTVQSPARVTHQWTPSDGFVQQPLEFPASLTAEESSPGRTATLTAPTSFKTDFHFKTQACAAPPTVALTMTRWGPDTQTFEFVDPDGLTQTYSEASTCHSLATTALQALNLIEPAPDAVALLMKYPFQGQVWRMKPPLLNRQEQILDETWNQQTSFTDLSVKIRLQAWHRPQ